MTDSLSPPLLRSGFFADCCSKRGQFLRQHFPLLHLHQHGVHQQLCRGDLWGVEVGETEQERERETDMDVKIREKGLLWFFFFTWQLFRGPGHVCVCVCDDRLELRQAGLGVELIFTHSFFLFFGTTIFAEIKTIKYAAWEFNLNLPAEMSSVPPADAWVRLFHLFVKI